MSEIFLHFLELAATSIFEKTKVKTMKQSVLKIVLTCDLKDLRLQLKNAQEGEARQARENQGKIAKCPI